MTALLAALTHHSPSPQIACDLYLPVARWCLARQAERGGRTVILGVNGPQGSGKSTLAAALVAGLASQGLRGIACSIDDFYLTHAQQRALAAAHPGDPLLEHRGYPGTHDVALGTATLAALAAGQPTVLPVYDKSAFAGRGDRAPTARWVSAPGGLDFALVEGWMLGFTPCPRPPAALETTNRLLADYAAWNALIDAMVLIEADDLQSIVAWRVDAERARRARGEGALTEAEARDYIERFLPAYRAWLPGLRAAPPGRAWLRVSLAADRRPSAPLSDVWEQP